MDKLKSVQDKLCLCLSTNPDFIIDKCGDILTRNESLKIEKQNSGLEKMRALMKIITGKGDDVCQTFLGILKQHQTRYEQLPQLFTQGKDQSVKIIITSSDRQHHRGYDIYVYIFLFCIYRSTSSNSVCCW